MLGFTLFVYFQSAEELLYAIMLINRNETLLPGVELQLDIQADCLTDTIALTEVRLNGGRNALRHISSLKQFGSRLFIVIRLVETQKWHL